MTYLWQHSKTTLLYFFARSVAVPAETASKSCSSAVQRAGVGSDCSRIYVY